MTGGKLLKNRNVGFRYSLPMGLWFTLFFLLPLAIIISYSFMKKGLHGGVEYSFSLNAYIQMMNASYGKLFVRTLWVTFLATLISIILALPCGYAMARSKNQTLLLFLIIIPFWTNSLIRINAWIAILGNQGFINNPAQSRADQGKPAAPVQPVGGYPGTCVYVSSIRDSAGVYRNGQVRLFIARSRPGSGSYKITVHV